MAPFMGAASEMVLTFASQKGLPVEAAWYLQNELSFYDYCFNLNIYFNKSANVFLKMKHEHIKAII